MEGNDEVAASGPLGDPVGEDDGKLKNDNGSSNDKPEISGNDGKDGVCVDIMDNGGSDNKCEHSSYKTVLTETSVPIFPKTTCFESRFERIPVTEGSNGDGRTATHGDRRDADKDGGVAREHECGDGRNPSNGLKTLTLSPNEDMVKGVSVE